MGCASSKQKRCRHCQNPYSPMVRSYSMHVHHPPVAKDDSYHLVALTSSTLGSLRLDSSNEGNSHIDGKTISNWFDRRINAEEEENVNVEDKQSKSKDFSVGLVEAKTWSNMINEKIPKIVPKTPIRTPPGEPETINTWELMEGLEDISPFRSPIHQRSFSFDVVRDPNPIPAVPLDRPKSKLQENGTASPKPIWLQLADEGDLNSNIPEFDPEIISHFRKSLEEHSPENGFHLQPSDNDHEEDEEEQSTASDDSSLDMKMENRVSTDQKLPNSGKEKEKLVLYFTSLRGVRKTYEDCCHVRVILKTIGVRVDERDVSMHSGFKDELKELLKEGFYTGGLPRVFLGKNYIGGAEEIRRLHEDGQLEKLLECCEKIADGGCDGGGACEACGDIRFVPCETCSGSCKIYYEDDDDDDDDDEEEEEEEGDKEGYGFQRCPDCNENGLIRCPICCY